MKSERIMLEAFLPEFSGLKSPGWAEFLAGPRIRAAESYEFLQISDYRLGRDDYLDVLDAAHDPAKQCSKLAKSYCVMFGIHLALKLGIPHGLRFERYDAEADRIVASIPISAVCWYPSSLRGEAPSFPRGHRAPRVRTALGFRSGIEQLPERGCGAVPAPVGSRRGRHAVEGIRRSQRREEGDRDPRDRRSRARVLELDRSGQVSVRSAAAPSGEIRAVVRAPARRDDPVETAELSGRKGKTHDDE
jgi:hypothetical protein